MSPMDAKTPFDLWIEANGDRALYRKLLVAYGHVVPNEPCAECGQTFRHRHDSLDLDRIIRTDIFGHDEEAGDTDRAGGRG